MAANTTNRITIGTRGSKLALWQANWVKSTLEKAHPSLSVALQILKTRGDKILDAPLAKVGGKGLFVKEIEEALLDGRIDLAVHSLKDMPSEIPEGLRIGASPVRENPGDVLISGDGRPLSRLTPGARVGTSSLRRKAQLLRARPDLVIESMRGNLDTRLRKLDQGEADAIVLAAAGVIRLGLQERITEFLDHEIMLPAVGQGALCIEIREEDPRVAALVETLHHPETGRVVRGERAFLHRLEGGCQVPIAAHGEIEGDLFLLQGLVADEAGAVVIRESLSGPAADAKGVGRRLAERILGLGADKILEQFYAGGDGDDAR
ncbi:MAG: hydroxymethylbilane synthase [Desulfobacterales bacterium]|nr:hydroxymethylbilane synthase [Desulfobacterales bacterium]